MDLASVVAALASVGVRVSGSTPNNNIQGDSSRACPTGLAGPEPSGTHNDPGQHFHTADEQQGAVVPSTGQRLPSTTVGYWSTGRTASTKAESSAAPAPPPHTANLPHSHRTITGPSHRGDGIASPIISPQRSFTLSGPLNNNAPLQSPTVSDGRGRQVVSVRRKPALSATSSPRAHSLQANALHNRHQ